MIYEFALAPNLVATWHDRREFLFFEEKFNLRTGRLISEYPKKWRSLVWNAFEAGDHGQNQNARMRLDALLQDLCQNSIKRTSTFPDIHDWLERAEAEHAERPFFGLLAQENPRRHGQVILAPKLIEEGDERWLIPDTLPVPRSADEIVAAVAPILRICRRILFIDPYFDPTKRRFMGPMRGFFGEIWAKRDEYNSPVVEIHTCIDRYFKAHEVGDNRNPERELGIITYLVSEMNSRLSKIIPRGKTVEVSLWKQREAGQRFHNRYILTEACGVAFGTGLDQEEEPSPDVTDDLHRLDAGKLSARWKEYFGNPPAFDLAAKPFVVQGQFL